MFTTTELQCYFKTVGMNVVEVLHSAWNIIPFCTISNSIWKWVSTLIALSHRAMIVGVNSCNFLEKFVIWWSRIKARAMSGWIIKWIGCYHGPTMKICYKNQDFFLLSCNFKSDKVVLEVILKETDTWFSSIMPLSHWKWPAKKCTYPKGQMVHS